MRCPEHFLFPKFYKAFKIRAVLSFIIDCEPANQNSRLFKQSGAELRQIMTWFTYTRFPALAWIGNATNQKQTFNWLRVLIGLSRKVLRCDWLIRKSLYMHSSHLGFPRRAAWCRALKPLLFATVTSALASSNIVTISSRFFEMASCNGVSPSVS